MIEDLMHIRQNNEIIGYIGYDENGYNTSDITKKPIGQVKSIYEKMIKEGFNKQTESLLTHCEEQVLIEKYGNVPSIINNHKYYTTENYKNAKKLHNLFLNN